MGSLNRLSGNVSRTVTLLSCTILSGTAGAVCPAIGADTDCGIIITVTNSGASITATGQGPYDGIEDTLVGVVNSSNRPIYAIGLKSSTTIFGFDGDGIDTYGVAGNGRDPTGYGGPNAYFTDVTAANTAGTVRFLTPIPTGGTAYFSLEEAISSADPCTQLLNKALSGPKIVNTTGITASFTPNNGYSLAQAASICGFQNFDWQQTITQWPKPSPLFQVGNPKPLSAPPPFLDPPPGGYTYEGAADNSYPFYYDWKSGELQSHETTNTLNFGDAPADPCLWGGSGSGCSGKTAPKGAKLAFTTKLVGINTDGTPADLGISFSWTSNFNGTSGGVARTKNDLPVDAGSGTGGIQIQSIQNVPTLLSVGVTSINDASVTTAQTLSDGSACNGTYGGTVNGDLVVTTGQVCTLVNAEIMGNVHQSGGSLQLVGTAVDGNVQVSNNSTLDVESYSSFNGDVEIAQISGNNAVRLCSATVYGNLHIHNNTEAAFQIGTNADNCAGNVIGSNVEIHNNNALTIIGANTVTGNLHDHNNPGATTLISNDVVGILQCEGNSSIVGSGNLAAKKLGQCQAF